MTFRFCLLILLVPVFEGCLRGPNHKGPPIQELELVAVYPLDNPDGLEPSGLVHTPAGLLTVADKVDTSIYRVEIDESGARLVKFLDFQSPGPRALDWEGISADDQGTLYLISETYGRILQVQPDGSSGWLSTDLRVVSRNQGLFNKINAGFEGLTFVEPDLWIGAVEREPRGLVTLNTSTQPPTITAHQHMDSTFMEVLPIHRIPDYSGLDTEDGRVYALFRNAHLVVRLERDDNGWRDTKAWSYRHIETDPAWAYLTQTYGQAEGLAIHGEDVFIIMDNNRGPRLADPNDRRPLLIHARFPASIR